MRFSGAPILRLGARLVPWLKRWKSLHLNCADTDEHGTLTGIAYDRVALALIPLLRDLTNRIEHLEGAPVTEWPESPSYDDTALWDEVTAYGSEEPEQPMPSNERRNCCQRRTCTSTLGQANHDGLTPANLEGAVPGSGGSPVHRLTNCWRTNERDRREPCDR